MLGLADEVIRHKVIRLPEKALRSPRGSQVPGASHSDSAAGGRERERSKLSMSNGNHVSIVGNLTRDPELRFTPSGQATATFGVAVNRRWQNRQSQEWEEATSFFDVVCWGQLAENAAQSLDQGAPESWSPAAWTSAAGRPPTASGAPRSRSPPTKSAPACAGRPPSVTKNERRGPRDGRSSSCSSRGRPVDQRAARRRTLLRRGAVLSHGTQQRPRSQGPKRALKDTRPRGKKKVCIFCKDHGRLGRLQGRQPSAPIHERPRQDPLAAGHRQLRPASARSPGRHQDRSGGRPLALHPAHRQRAQVPVEARADP